LIYAHFNYLVTFVDFQKFTARELIASQFSVNPQIIRRIYIKISSIYTCNCFVCYTFNFMYKFHPIAMLSYKFLRINLLLASNEIQELIKSGQKVDRDIRALVTDHTGPISGSRFAACCANLVRSGILGRNATRAFIRITRVLLHAMRVR